MTAIETTNLYKSYDGMMVLHGLNMHVPSGVVYGLIGPNGAGKSTLIHLLLGFLKPDQGTVHVLGNLHPARVRHRVGYLPERLRYHLRYTAREYLHYLGQFDDLSGPALNRRIDEELRTVGLADAADRMLSEYSRGMLQRFGVAQALLHDPELLLIDEPTGGLDPGGQREMLDLLGALRGRGHTTFMATHVLDEAECVCDRVGVLFEGRMAAESEIHELTGPARSVVIKIGPLPAILVEQLINLSPAIHFRGHNIAIQPNSQALQSQVLRILLDADIPILGLEPQVRPLEDFYMRVVRGEPVGASLAPPLDHTPGRDTLLSELLEKKQSQE